MIPKRVHAIARGVILVSAMALAVAAPAAAQKPTFDIDGVVTDAQQGVLPGATVVLKNVATGLSREIRRVAVLLNELVKIRSGF